MSRMDFNKVEARGVGSLCGAGEGADQGRDFGFIQGLRHGVGMGERDCAWGDGLPAALFWRQQTLAAERDGHAGLASRMRELNPCAGSLGVNEPNDLSELLDMLVFPDSQITN